LARIRTIKPEFWTSEQVVECSPIARLMFIGMWNFCDDGGNHPASYKTLKMEVFPGDEISLSQIEQYTNELVKNNLIARYNGGNGREYWHVTGWDHQKIDRPNPKHPEYEPHKIVDHSTNDKRTVDDQSPQEGKVREGKGKESKGSGSGASIEAVKINLPEQDLVSQEIWDEFLKLRTKLKAVNSPLAIKSLLTELKKLKSQGCDPDDVVNQSIRSSWKDVYPVKSRDSPKRNEDNKIDFNRQQTELAKKRLFGQSNPVEKDITNASAAL